MSVATLCTEAQNPTHQSRVKLDPVPFTIPTQVPLLSASVTSHAELVNATSASAHVFAKSTPNFLAKEIEPRPFPVV